MPISRLPCDHQSARVSRIAFHVSFVNPSLIIIRDEDSDWTHWVFAIDDLRVDQPVLRMCMPGVYPPDSMDMVSGSGHSIIASWGRATGGYFIGVTRWKDKDPTKCIDIHDFEAWRLPPSLVSVSNRMNCMLALTSIS
jgi:hypothetical protein